MFQAQHPLAECYITKQTHLICIVLLPERHVEDSNQAYKLASNLVRITQRWALILVCAMDAK